MGCGPIFFTTGLPIGAFLFWGLVVKFWVPILIIAGFLLVCFVCAACKS